METSPPRGLAGASVDVLRFATRSKEAARRIEAGALPDRSIAMNRPSQVESIFFDALEKKTAAERAEYLDRACGGDVELRRRVERLLATYPRGEDYLAKPAVKLPEFGPTVVVREPTATVAASGPMGDDVTYSFEPVQPGQVLEALARSIGPIPRVLLPDTSPDDAGVAVIKPSSEEVPAPGKRGERYHLFGEIARGGMGVVIKGRDPDLGREVAVKVLLASQREKPELVRRFVEEAQIGGQLQHPGIVPVYELGAFADQRPYFTMKLVKGRTLAALLGERRSPAHDLPRFLSIFESVCQTVAYAHARRVIHRDLKPSNVMVGSFGEVQVMDWGLAKVLKEGGDADEHPTRPAAEEAAIATVRSGSTLHESVAGSVIGTPAYMAPEQAAGEVERVDRRADVFGLGAILCEILTGEAVYIGQGSQEVVRMAMRGETADALARLDGCGAEAELIALAKDCVAIEPADRPQGAGLVAERMTAYLAGVQERVQAAERERAVAVARAVEERRRCKVQLQLAAAVLALLTLGGLSAMYYLQQRQARAAAAERIIDQVSTLRGQALAQPEEVPRWEVALAAVDQADPAGDPSARTQLVALRTVIRAGLDAARRDKTLLDRLVDIRSGEADDQGGALIDRDYADAFRQAGIDLATLTPAEAGALIRTRSPRAAPALAAALDDWASVRRGKRSDAAGAARLSEAARVADPDPWRALLRMVLDRPEKAARLDGLRALARTAKFEELGAISLHLLGAGLNDAGDGALAESVLRRAQRRHPRDVWINHTLGAVLERLSRHDEAIRFYTAARAIRPETGFNLALNLERRGDYDEAYAVFLDLKALRPSTRNLNFLSGFLKDKKGLAQDAETMSKAAEAAGREAVRLRPDDAVAHHDLANALNGEESVAEFRTAIRLKPDSAPMRFNLGLRLEQLGRHAEAETELHGAIRVKPDYAEAHGLLGDILLAQGKLDEAIALYRTSIRLKPGLAEAHRCLGLALPRQDKLDEAVAELRLTTLLQPSYAEAHCDLGGLLKQQGDYAWALDMYRKGHALGSRRADWPKESVQWVAQAERELALSPRFRALIRGEDRPRDNVEHLTLAQMAFDRKLFAAAARHWSGALASDPKLGDDREAGHSYRAAVAAVLAGVGLGKDEPPPDEAAKAKLRRQSLEGLKAELATSTKLVNTGARQARATVERDLTRWKQDRDLAGIREPEALAGLPEAERKGWHALWADVDSLLKRAAAP
jgi:serine/threonine-protein kinase